MALADLAATSDLTARGITWTSPAEDTIVDTFLTVASAMVREAAGVPILQTTSTVTLGGTCGQWLPLPGQPIQSVSSVSIDGTAVTDWRVSSGQLWRRGGWQADDGPSEVEVSMTHGLASVPADIVDLVCSMVAAGLKAQREQADGSGLAARDPSLQSKSEAVGGYSTSVAYATGRDAAEASPTAMSLPQRTRDALAARFGGAAAVLVLR